MSYVTAALLHRAENDLSDADDDFDYQATALLRAAPRATLAPHKYAPTRTHTHLVAAVALVQPDHCVITHGCDDPVLLLVSDARDVRVERAALLDADVIGGKGKTKKVRSQLAVG